MLETVYSVQNNSENDGTCNLFKGLQVFFIHRIPRLIKTKQSKKKEEQRL